MSYNFWPDWLPKVREEDPCYHRTPCYSIDSGCKCHSSVEWEILQKYLIRRNFSVDSLPICSALYYKDVNSVMKLYRKRCNLLGELPNVCKENDRVHHNVSNSYLYENIIEPLETRLIQEIK